MNTQDEMHRKIKSHNKNTLVFDLDANNFVPAHYPPKEDGMYVTIRCGSTGISQRLDQWKDGEWQLKVLDDSKVIAYSEKVEFGTFIYDDTKGL